MTLLIREGDVQDLLPMSEAVRLVRDALSARPADGTDNLPRRRVDLDHGRLNVMAAVVESQKSAGLKAYSAAGGATRFLVGLWDSETGRLLALIEARTLGQIRTGAASAVATDALAFERATRLTIIGSGFQAETQAAGIASVRQLSSIAVFSRDAGRREEFARLISGQLGVPAIAAKSVREAVSTADVVCTVTTSGQPVVEGEWLQPVCHVNAAGSNDPRRRELSNSVLSRATTIAVDSIDQARIESGDLLLPIGEGELSWDRVHELSEILRRPRERGNGVSVFKSLGIAVEDVAVARYIYDRAIELGRGERTTFGEVDP